MAASDPRRERACGQLAFGAALGVVLLIGVGYGTAELCNAEPGSLEAECATGSLVLGSSIVLVGVAAIGIGLAPRWRWSCSVAAFAQLTVFGVAISIMV